MPDAPEQEESKLKPAFERNEAGLRLVASISPDKLKLFIAAKCESPEAAAAVTRETLERHLEQVPKEFLHLDILDSIVTALKNGEEVKARRIAKGVAPREGKNGRILLLVKPYANPDREKPIQLVDPRYIKNFDNIEVGNPLARIYPPQPGTPGRDCFGAAVAAPAGKPVQWKSDQTIKVLPPTDQAAFHTLVANEAGYLTEEKGSFTIKTELVLPEVSFRSGDIDFVGAVRIQGDVHKGFKVRARKNIDVAGDVDQSTLISEEGAIKVQGAIIGSAREQVLAGSSLTSGMLQEARRVAGSQIFSHSMLTASLIDGATIEAYGNVHVAREIRGSIIRTRGILSALEGQVVSGDIYSCCGVEAKRVGSKLGGQLSITACSDVESTHDYQELLKKIRKHEELEETLRLQLGPYAGNNARIQLLAPSIRSKIDLLKLKLKSVGDSKRTLIAEKEKLLAEAQVNPTFRVNFHEIAHAGVTVHAGENLFTVSEDVKGPGTIEYHLTEKRFEVEKLKALECFVNPDGTPALPRQPARTPEAPASS